MIKILFICIACAKKIQKTLAGAAVLRRSCQCGTGKMQNMPSPAGNFTSIVRQFTVPGRNAKPYPLVYIDCYLRSLPPRGTLIRYHGRTGLSTVEMSEFHTFETFSPSICTTLLSRTRCRSRGSCSARGRAIPHGSRARGCVHRRAETPFPPQCRRRPRSRPRFQ